MESLNNTTKRKLLRRVIVDVKDNVIVLDNGTEISITSSTAKELNTALEGLHPAEAAQQQAEQDERDLQALKNQSADNTTETDESAN